MGPARPRRGELLLLDGLDGAVADAGAALSAQILVDLVVLGALGDSVDGAVAGASAAGNAAVGNDVHGKVPPLFGIPAFYHICYKMQHKKPNQDEKILKNEEN